MLQDMAAKGVHCVDCVSVDNALVRPADPLFLGTCSQRQADCGDPLSTSLQPVPGAHPACMGCPICQNSEHPVRWMASSNAA